MIEKHPGGIRMTRHLIELSGITPCHGSAPMESSVLCRDSAPTPGTSLCHDSAPAAKNSTCRILDMGAGDGHAVRLLNSMGFDAKGIDLSPGTDTPEGSLLCGNFLHCPFPDQTFDAVISECAFYVSGDADSALKEAARILKKSGLLLLADVSFSDTGTHVHTLEAAGFSVLKLEDCTSLWKEYYISCIWNGTAEQLCPCIPKGKCRYYLTVCERM